jgi:hypothetical protein
MIRERGKSDSLLWSIACEGWIFLKKMKIWMLMGVLLFHVREKGNGEEFF